MEQIMRKDKRQPQSAATGKSKLRPRTLNEYRAKSQRFQDVWNRVTHVITKMRSDKVSLPQASREFGLSPQTVIRLGGSALRKRANGQYGARSSDRLLRVLVIPTSKGLQEVAVSNSEDASTLGKFWDAVQDYLETGDSKALRKFRGKRIIGADGEAIPLITDVAELDRLGSAGVLSFESLYAQAA
jgi:hypothetical protein